MGGGGEVTYIEAEMYVEAQIFPPLLVKPRTELIISAHEF